MVSVALGVESDGTAIGRPGGETSIADIVGEAQGVGAISIHEIDFTVAVAGGGKGNFSAVGRPRGMVVP